MNYFKSLGFYFCEVAGAMLNFLCSLVGGYPAFDLGVTFLLHFEEKRISGERVERQALRDEKKVEADNLMVKAEENG